MSELYIGIDIFVLFVLNNLLLFSANDVSLTEICQYESPKIYKIY